jgi:endonuclease/exonuclease/phosphatase family metal-dependent hydrolase
MLIVSWNIHRCIGSDGRYRPDRIVEVLHVLNADVIALQEVDSSLRSDNGEDQLTYISRSLGMLPILGPTLSFDYGSYGNAILTRHQIHYWDEYDLSYRKFEPRGAIAVGVKFQIEGRSRQMRIVGTHLGLKYWERTFQIDRLLGGVVWKDEPVTILLGDFNEWFPFSGNYLRLSRAFLPCPRLATFPAVWPRFALDRIYISGLVNKVNWSTVSHSLSSVASDHLPVLANIDLKNLSS